MDAEDLDSQSGSGSEGSEIEESDGSPESSPGPLPPRPGNEAFATAAAGLREMDLEGGPAAELTPDNATDEEYYEQILDALKLYLSTSNRLENATFDQGIAQKLLTGNLADLRRGGTPWKAEVRRMQMIAAHNRTIKLFEEMREQLTKATVMIDLVAAKGMHSVGLVGEYDPVLMAKVLTQNPERVQANRKWASSVVQELQNAGFMQQMNSPWLMIGLLIFERLHSAQEAVRAAPKQPSLPTAPTQNPQAAAPPSQMQGPPPTFAAPPTLPPPARTAMPELPARTSLPLPPAPARSTLNLDLK